MQERIDKISWQHHEHAHIDRSIDWFWSLGIILVGALILTIYFKVFLFSIIVILFGFLAFHNAKRTPPLLRFDITRKGVRAGNTLFPYSMLESFWVEDTEYRDVILFKSKKPFTPILTIPFDSTEIDPELIRDYLLDYLHEEELEEPLYHVIMERLGF